MQAFNRKGGGAGGQVGGPLVPPPLSGGGVSLRGHLYPSPSPLTIEAAAS